MRAMLGMPILDFPTPYAADADAYLQRGLAARDAFKHAPRLSFSLAPHAPYTVRRRDVAARSSCTRASSTSSIQTHVAETQARGRRRACRALHETPLARLDRLGATGPAFIAIHAVHLDAARHRPARRRRAATSSIARLQHEARERHRAGRRRCSRAASTSRSAPMAPRRTTASTCFDEMRLASLLAKVATGDAAALPAATRAADGNAQRRTRAGPRRARSARSMSGKEADVTAVDSPTSKRCRCTIRFRISSTRPDAST